MINYAAREAIRAIEVWSRARADFEAADFCRQQGEYIDSGRVQWPPPGDVEVKFSLPNEGKRTP